MLEIIVPATSANIGPGFDCLGIALNLYNTFYIEEINNGVEITGCDDEFMTNNLVYKSMKFFFDNIDCKYIPSGIRINIKSNIPISRGLGSSASCVIAGVLAANELSKSNLSKKELLKIATQIEGHPDNVTPALFGNMTISLLDNSNIHYDIIKVPNNLSFCAIIPDFTLSTERARSVLPKHISLQDAVYNISRASLLISSILNNNFDLIKIACEDKIHQQYRSNLINNYYDIINKANSNSLGSFLSGAGPTIISILDGNTNDYLVDIKNFLGNLNSKWTIKTLICDNIGAIINII
ncbi:MAG: homoserine kinase [Peptostreptococcaceae bacterium]